MNRILRRRRKSSRLLCFWEGLTLEKQRSIITEESLPGTKLNKCGHWTVIVRVEHWNPHPLSRPSKHGIVWIGERGRGGGRVREIEKDRGKNEYPGRQLLPISSLSPFQPSLEVNNFPTVLYFVRRASLSLLLFTFSFENSTVWQSKGGRCRENRTLGTIT